MRASNMRAQGLPTMAPAQGRWPLRMVAQLQLATEIAVGNALATVRFVKTCGKFCDLL